MLSGINNVPDVPATPIEPWRLKARKHFQPRYVDQLETAWDWSWNRLWKFYEWVETQLGPNERAYLGLIDRYYLLVVLLKRVDFLDHGSKGSQWLFERCREVEREPDNCLDLWSREHYKSSIITFGGIIQEVLRDSEVTVGIFSFNKREAKKPLSQIKRELEENRELQALYPHILWQDPKKQAPMWALDTGIIVRRRTNPKNATVEAHGLVEGMPTGSHFLLRVYDDVVTKESVSNTEMIKKVTEARELSDNLGAKLGGREWNIGTRYHFADTYGVYLDRNVFKARIYAATSNGQLDGTPVFLTEQEWADKKKKQPSQVPAQMLQNPRAGKDQLFKAKWLSAYWTRPRTLNIYIVVDPSKGSAPSRRTDRTAMAVVGVDAGLNKYLLDGFRHRMRLDERWQCLKRLHRKWSKMPGVLSVSVGYEQYGMVTDIEHFESRMRLEKYHFPIKELNWTRDHNESKTDRIQRLVPDVMDGSFFLPAVARVEPNKTHYWAYQEKEDRIVYAELQGKPEVWAKMKQQDQEYRNASSIVRLDEEENPYDMTTCAIEELLFAPFGLHDDLVDVLSRIYDMQPRPPMIVHSGTAEPPVYAEDRVA